MYLGVLYFYCQLSNQYFTVHHAMHLVWLKQ